MLVGEEVFDRSFPAAHNTTQASRQVHCCVGITAVTWRELLVRRPANDNSELTEVRDEGTAGLTVMRMVTVACPGGMTPPWSMASTWKVKEVPMPIAARSSKSRVCSTASSPVTAFRENSCLADSVLIRYVTLEKRSASVAFQSDGTGRRAKVKLEKASSDGTQKGKKKKKETHEYTG